MTAVAEDEKGTASALFGRGMIYVIVWSAQLVVSSAVSPVLAHLLVPSEFGYLSTSIALFQLFSVLMVFGLDQALVMEHGDGGDRRVSAGRVIWLACGLSSLLTGVLLATGGLWAGSVGFPGFQGIVVLAVLWSGPGAVNLVIMALLRTQDRLGAFVVVNLLASIGGQVGGLLVLTGGSRTATAYGWAGVLAQYTALAIGLVVVRPRFRGLFDREWAARVVGAGSSLAMSALALFLLNTGDRIVLQRLDGAAAVAKYQIAYIIGSVPILLLAFLNQAWLPRILEIGDRTRQSQVLGRSRDLLLDILAPSVAALVVVAPLALRVLAPADYGVRGLVAVVFWVAIAAIPVASCAATTRALIARRRTGSVAIATGVAALLNIALNLVLIPEWHVAGSAFATFAAFVVQAVVARLLLGRQAALPRLDLRTRLHVATFLLLAATGAAVPLPVSASTQLMQLTVAAILGSVALHLLLRARSSEL